jgi:hypothetical protein
LRDWGTAGLFRDIITNKIEEILNARNGGASPGNAIHYKQLFHFNYQDGAKMLTVGGVLHDEGQVGHLAASRLDSLEFSRTDEDPFNIDIPNLTYRELRFLDRGFPFTGDLPTNVKGIPAGDVLKYLRVYRYFPTFAQTEV